MDATSPPLIEMIFIILKGVMRMSNPETLKVNALSGFWLI